jgi:mono/diheme cytochrome c family protein
MRRTFILLAVMGGLAGCATLGPAGGPAAERGRFVAQRSCAGCHAVEGVAGSPNPVAPTFSVLRARHDETGLKRRLAEISRDGHHQMPPIYMTQDEIGDIAAYIRTLEPVRPGQSVNLRPGAAARLHQGRA